MEKKTGFFNGILHIFYALNYSLQGLFTAFRLSTAIKQEFLVLFLLGALGWYTQKVLYLAAASIIAWLFVIVTELLNSAIEEALDLITHEYSTKVKAAKDMGSAAVFILVLVNIFVQSLIYLPELYKLAEYVKLYLNK